MNYINIETKEVISRSQLEELFSEPKVCFPENVVDDVLLDFGYANVGVEDVPTISTGQILKRGPVVEDEEGRYNYTWIVEDRQVDASEVDLERERRLDLGVLFKGQIIQTRASDRENITGAVQLAFIAVTQGAKAGDLLWFDGENDFEWITSENTTIQMDAFDMIELGRVVAARKQELVFKARQLKSMDKIPFDFTEDKWWE